MANHVRLYVRDAPTIVNNVVTEGVNKPVEIIRSVVERNGTRAVDTGIFTLTRKFKIEKGYKFQYIQDVVSPKYLVGLWNMEHNTRDESGHDIDGDEATSTIHEGSFAAKANGYAYKNKSGNNGRPIRIPRTGQITHFDHLKLDRQFDIIILGGNYNGNPNSYTGYLLGKGSSATSIQIKTISGGATSTAMVITAVLIIGGSTYTLTGTTNVNYSGNTYGSGGMQDFYWIRLKRDSNNLVSLIVNDNVEDTDTVVGDFTTNDDLYIAGDRQGNNTLDTNQYTAQVRIYSGYSLTDAEWDTLRSAKRSTEIMKFGGIVWKIDEKLTHKICYCKGLSDKLHNITIATGNNTYPTWTTNDSNIVKNEYFGKDGREIMEDLIKVYDIGMNVAAPSDYLTTEFDHYHATGTLYDNLNLLNLADNTAATSFHITPRGTILLERDDISHIDPDIVFRQGALSRFSNFGYDDTNLITQLTLIGNIPMVSGALKNTSNDWASSVTTGYGYIQTANGLRGKPVTCEVIDPDGTQLVSLHDTSVNSSYDANPILHHRILFTGTSGGGVVGQPVPAGTDQFKVDYHNRKIYLGASSSSNSSGGAPFSVSGKYYVIKYTYQDTNNNNNYWTQKGGNYDLLGNYSKVWHISQFAGTYPLSSVASMVNTKLGDLERRVTITVPTLINHIRENYEVKVVDPDHAVGTEDSSGTNNDTPITLSVKSMKFLYPEGFTIINCGEHMFDSFDLDKAFSEAHGQQKSNIIGSPA
jgi:hypothetical protein